MLGKADVLERIFGNDALFIESLPANERAALYDKKCSTRSELVAVFDQRTKDRGLGQLAADVADGIAEFGVAVLNGRIGPELFRFRKRLGSELGAAIAGEPEMFGERLGKAAVNLDALLEFPGQKPDRLVHLGAMLGEFHFKILLKGVNFLTH